MFDETTDFTVTEQLAVHGRFINKDTGKLKTHFLKVMDVLGPDIDALRPDSGAENLDACISVGARTITPRILDYTKEAGLDMSKLRGVGTDGAATMIGCKTGVVTRLKEITPTLIGVHCAAHRLNLASSQAADKVPYVKVQNIIRQLFDFFDNSAVRMAGLEAMQSLLQEKGRLLANCTTRRLSTERSVTRLKTCYISVVLSIQREGEERSDAKAIGLSSL